MERECLLKCLGQASNYDIKNEFRDFGSIEKKKQILDDMMFIKIIYPVQV